MSCHGEKAAERRRANAKAIAALGAKSSVETSRALERKVREGNGTTIFTIGYERRTGEGLVAELRDVGVDLLIDVRERPISRKADFRKAVLERLCDTVGLSYESWPRLGSTGHQRRQLRETGHLGEFRRRYRDFAQRGRHDVLDRLAEVAKQNTIALICYERVHEECHRSIVADLVADRIDATVVAIC